MKIHGIPWRCLNSLFSTRIAKQVLIWYWYIVQSMLQRMRYEPSQSVIVGVRKLVPSPTIHWHRLSPPSPSSIPSLPKTPPSRSRSGGGIGHSPTTNRYRKEYRIEWTKVPKTRFYECTCAILRFWPFWAFHTIIMGDRKDASTTHSERYATPPRRHSMRQALHLVFITDALSMLSSQCMHTL